MQQASYPAIQQLVLLGGGHSHAIALKQLAMNPIAGLRITLISDCGQTPYSGMLPGHVAGFYTYDETHIDLHHLTRFAQVDFYRDRAIGLDLQQNQVICENHPPVRFDWLSVDIGSTPKTSDVSGVKDYAIAAKPVPQFLTAWAQFFTKIDPTTNSFYPIAIVGGGAGGVELALNMDARLRQVLKPSQFSITIIHRGRWLMSGHNRGVSRKLTEILRSRSIKIHCSETVTAVEPEQVRCASGLGIASAFTVWVTQASSPVWIAESGLKTCDRGFILVGDTLQSVSHPQVFAAGDIATMQNHPRPKAGVFAVRQGKPLAENWRRLALGQPLKPFVPQKRYLALIGTGDRRAVASWAGLSWTAGWLWDWKDHIDRKFMTQFADLPLMKPAAQAAIPLPPEHPKMYCAGCGSKVGATVLQAVMTQLQISPHPDAIAGLSQPDDAAVIKTSGEYSVQTIDQFRTMVRDPYVFGQIATHHSLSDLWAMGATPQTVLATVTLPYGTDAIVGEVLFHVLSGVLAALASTTATLVGGHTNLGDQLALGLACYGTVNSEQLLTKSKLQPDQALILTKPLGTGTILAADQRGQVHPQWLEGAIAVMRQSNQKAAQILQQYDVTACTDVTGFGLAGHLLEMLRASDCGATIHPEKIPTLPGALSLLNQGITSSLHIKNQQMAAAIAGQCDPARWQLLFDPQTSGGLLFALPSDQAQGCVMQLQQQGYPATVIGHVNEGSVGFTLV